MYELIKCKCGMMQYVRLSQRKCEFCKADFASQGVNFEKMAIEESRENYRKKLEIIFRGLFFLIFISIILFYRNGLFDQGWRGWILWVLFFIFLVFDTRIVKYFSRSIARWQYPDLNDAS